MWVDVPGLTDVLLFSSPTLLLYSSPLLVSSTRLLVFSPSLLPPLVFPSQVSFFGWRLSVRRTDGATLLASVSPYPQELFKFVSIRRWEEAVRLCRFVKDDALWAALAAMAIQQQSLDTAETAFAAIKEAEKLQYIMYIKEVPSEEGRRAEIALYQRRPAEAERILLQASPPLIYRAIKMNIRRFQWTRALDIAVEHRTHVDTVLGYRQKYLKAYGRTETDSRFQQMAQEVEVDWEAINTKKRQEAEKERERGPGAPLGGGGGGSAERDEGKMG